MRKISKNRKERVILCTFFIFALLSELVHVYIGTNPPEYLRLGYIVVYLFFCFINVRLIPIFITINLIFERFSMVYGEFLPNTMWFHLVILFFCYLQIKSANKRKSYVSYRLFEYNCIIVFALYVFLSAFIYINYSFFLYVLFSLLLFNVLTLLKNDDINLLINYAIISMLVICLIALINYDTLAVDYSITDGAVDRLAWKDSNYLSFFIGIIFLIALFKVIYAQKITEKNKYILVCFIFMVCLLLLISRGAILALLLACIYYFRNNLFSFKLLKYAFGVLIVVLILYNMGFMDGVLLRFASEDMATGSGRTDIWQAGIKTFFSEGIFTILLGAGEGQAMKMAVLNGQYFSPHNNYLEIIFNYGIVGFVLFLTWWVSMFVNSKTHEKRALIIFISISSMTIVPFTYVMPIWIIIPLLLMWDKRIKYIIYD